MIALCPHCNSEQSVTAVALQAQCGEVDCQQCGAQFRPRAHRLTPARERAFKQRQRAQEEQQRQRRELGRELETERRKLEQEDSWTDPEMATSDIAQAAQQRPNPGSDNKEGGVAMNDDREQNRNRDTRFAADGNARNDELEKARQTIARQKLLLDYRKLQHESEKLDVERKKLELERVKLEVLRKHNLLEEKKLKSAVFEAVDRVAEGDPRIEYEYDIRADILPRTPNAIQRDPRLQKQGRDHRNMPRESDAETVGSHADARLELLPSEPKTLVRRNIGTRANKIK